MGNFSQKLTFSVENGYFWSFRKPFLEIFVSNYFSLNVYDVFKSYWGEKKSLKRLENFDFFQNLSQNRHVFALKRAKRPPGAHWEHPRWQKLFFLVARIWKPHTSKNSFWVISHRKKVNLATTGYMAAILKRSPRKGLHLLASEKLYPIRLRLFTPKSTT